MTPREDRLKAVLETVNCSVLAKSMGVSRQGWRPGVQGCPLKATVRFIPGIHRPARSKACARRCRPSREGWVSNGG